MRIFENLLKNYDRENCGKQLHLSVCERKRERESESQAMKAFFSKKSYTSVTSRLEFLIKI